MGWRLLSKPRTQRVTKALAAEFAAMTAAPNDRPLSERRLQVYNRLLKEDQFRPVTWATAFCKETGDKFRVNGKHTSTMLSGLDSMPEFYVVIEEYECDSLKDVAELYGTFDSKMQSRTSRDIYLSFAGTVPQLVSINAGVLNAAVTGMAYHRFGEKEYLRSQPADRAELLFDNADFVTWYDRRVHITKKASGGGGVLERAFST